MADFKAALLVTLAHEGGYALSARPDDPGGATYAGISRVNHPTWAGWALVDRGVTRGARLEALVEEFYLLHFWDPIHGDEIQDQRIATSLLDYAVNVGLRTGVRHLQSLLGVKADGVVGPITIAALNLADVSVLVRMFALEKIRHYVRLCDRSAALRVFLLGWVRRSLDSVTA